MARPASTLAKAPPPRAVAIRPASHTVAAMATAATTRSARCDSPATCATSHATQPTSGG